MLEVLPTVHQALHAYLKNMITSLKKEISSHNSTFLIVSYIIIFVCATVACHATSYKSQPNCKHKAHCILHFRHLLFQHVEWKPSEEGHGLGISLLRWVSWLCPSQTQWTWLHYLTSLCFSFPTSKLEQIIVTTLERCCKKYNTICRAVAVNLWEQWFCLLGDSWQCQEIFWVITTGI